MEQVHSTLPAGWEREQVSELSQTTQEGPRKRSAVAELARLLVVLLPVAVLSAYQLWVDSRPPKAIELPMPASKATLMQMCSQLTPTPTPALYWPGQSPGFKP